MGFCTGCGRVILVLVNLVILLVALAILAVGVLLKFFAPKVLALWGSIPISDAIKTQFSIPDLSKVENLPLVNEVGIVLIVFGAVLCCISFLACCGACYKFRMLLILFAISLSVLVIAEAVVGGLFLAKNSVLHDTLKKTVGDEVSSSFNANKTDAVTFAMNILNYLVGCCGIRGPSDFSIKPPASCCEKSIIDGGDSTEQGRCMDGSSTHYNKEGCYDKILEMATSQLVIAAIVLGVLCFLQLVEVIFAVAIAVNNKVSPV